jgi:hypothetical protein
LFYQFEVKTLLFIIATSLAIPEYYDKYGAPMNKESSWEEGYHVVEKKLADYCNKIMEHDLEFPLIAGMGGGVHLYKPLHGEEEDKPWNCTGWIPRQKRWLSQGTFFSNRLVFCRYVDEFKIHQYS